MRIIFIRHGDPDYEHDTLTEKGIREAALLGERVRDWKVDELYVSCLGRARKTAEPVEAALNRKGIVLDWLQEFRGRIDAKRGYGDGYPWDFAPAFWTGIPELYDKETWYRAEIMQKNGDLPSVEEVYLETCEKLDGLLAAYGCRREKGYYRVEPGNDKTIVLVCHMAITFVMLSHLLGISFPALVHGMFLPPTSVTVVGSEEMEPGIASFRCQCMGDVWHLRKNGEPVSDKGYFGELFRE